MADEIKQTASMRLKNSTTGENLPRSSTQKITQTSQGQSYVVMHIGGVMEAIDLGDVTTVGCFFFKNTEATGGAYVRIGVDSGGFIGFLLLNPQEFSLGRLDPTDAAAPQAICEDSAGVFLESWILNT